MSNSYVNDFTDVVKNYYKNIKKCNPISIDEEKELMHKAKQGDIDARNRIISSNLKFVFDVAKRYKGYGVPMEDLISEGNMGLLYAFDKFDEEKNVKFISYAVWWIRWYIQDFIERRGCESVHEVSDDEIINEDIVEKTVSDDEDDKIKVSDTIMSNEIEMIEEENNNEKKQIISQLLEKLDERERKIIECYFGLNGNKEMNLQETGNTLHLSIERVRQIKEKTLLKLRSEMLILS